MVFVVLFFIPLLLVLLIAAFIPMPEAKKFDKGDKVKLKHWPGRTAAVEKWYDPKEAKKAFPRGVKGAEKPPYPAGVVEVKFDDIDFNTGKVYPNEVAAGTSAEKVKP